MSLCSEYRVTILAARYGIPATVVLERHGVPNTVEDFDGGGNTYAANRAAEARAHELSRTYQAPVLRA